MKSPDGLLAHFEIAERCGLADLSQPLFDQPDCRLVAARAEQYSFEHGRIHRSATCSPVGWPPTFLILEHGSRNHAWSS